MNASLGVTSASQSDSPHPHAIMVGWAELSADGRYRYALHRRWETSGPAVLFICLNPSTADAYEDDPTVRRCIGFAKAWGFGALSIGNLFAFRTPYPRALRQTPQPVGCANDLSLRRLAANSSLVVAAWGARGGYLGRDGEVRSLLGTLKCLGTTLGGHPRHPLYVRRNATLVELGD